MGDRDPPTKPEEWKGERRYDRAWELPSHRVNIGHPFAIGQTEVTLAEYQTFTTSTGYAPQPVCWTHEDGEWQEREGRSWLNPGYGQADNQPVVCVNRADAIAYMDWLSSVTKQTYRLPSEAEWEYASRASSITHYYWGDALGENNANCSDCGSPWDGKRTAPVASFPANGWGLFDMPGNVWEPVLDCFHMNYNGAPADGSAWDDPACSVWVLRGSSWYDLGAGMRSSFRGRGNPENRISDLGFRVVREMVDNAIPSGETSLRQP